MSNRPSKRKVVLIHDPLVYNYYRYNYSIVYPVVINFCIKIYLTANREGKLMESYTIF